MTTRVARPAVPQDARCALCDPQRTPERLYRTLFQLYGERARNLRRHGGQAVSRAAADAGVPITPDDVWRHFARHQRPQPRPRGPYLEDRALSSAEQLGSGARRAMHLIARLGVGTPDLLTRALYLPRASSRASAEAACYRDLHVLAHRGFIYRAPSSSIGRIATTGARTVLFPGRECQAYVARADGARPPVVTSPEDIDALAAAARLHAHEWLLDAAAGLSGDLPRMWLGREALAAEITLAGRPGSAHLALDGMAGVARSGETVSLLAYRSDDGHQAVTDIGWDIIRFGEAHSSGALAERIAPVPLDALPLVVIMLSPERKVALCAALAGRTFTGYPVPDVVVTDRMSVAHAGATGPVFTRPGASSPAPLMHAFHR